jgi:hypothetical protein
MSSSSSPSSSSSTTDPPAGGPNALVNLSIYASISLVYLYLNFKLPDNIVLKIVYLILMLGINFGLIFWMMSSQCKATPNLGVTIGGSVLTWIMFVVMFFALETMYVWLRPFGNTVGYLWIKLLKVVGFMDGILKQSVQADDDASRRMNKYINYVRSDPWGFFSMLTTNADAEPKILQAGEAFDELRGKLTQQAVNNFAANKQEFIDFVRIKESVAKFIFYLLTLNLMTDMTAVFVMENDNNCIVNANIVKGANDMHNQKPGGRRNPKPDPVVYTTTE